MSSWQRFVTFSLSLDKHTRGMGTRRLLFSLRSATNRHRRPLPLPFAGVSLGKLKLQEKEEEEEKERERPFGQKLSARQLTQMMDYP
ncbi:hypothetical protein E2320_016294, partial [Naja naja]